MLLEFQQVTITRKKTPGLLFRSLGIFLTFIPLTGTKPYSQKFIDFYLNSN